MSIHDCDPETVYSFVINVTPVDDESINIVRDFFVDEHILHSHGFTGVERMSIIVKYTAASLGKMLAWFTQHQNRFGDATIEIGREKVLIKGYPVEAATELLKSRAVSKLLRDLKQK